MTRGWKVTLAISLALNLLFVGFAAGRFFLRPHFGPFFGGPHAVEWMLGSLSAERRAVLEPQLRDAMATMRPNLDAFRQAQNQVLSALRAEPYSEAKLRAALTGVHRDMDATRNAFDESLLKVVAQLTPQERRDLAERLARPRFGPPD